MKREKSVRQHLMANVNQEDALKEYSFKTTKMKKKQGKRKRYIYTPFILTCNLFKINFSSVASSKTMRKKKRKAIFISHWFTRIGSYRWVYTYTHTHFFRCCASLWLHKYKMWCARNDIKLAQYPSCINVVSLFAPDLFMKIFEFSVCSFYHIENPSWVVATTFGAMMSFCCVFVHKKTSLDCIWCVHLSHRWSNNGVNCIWSIAIPFNDVCVCIALRRYFFVSSFFMFHLQNFHRNFHLMRYNVCVSRNELLPPSFFLVSVLLAILFAKAKAMQRKDKRKKLRQTMLRYQICIPVQTSKA